MAYEAIPYKTGQASIRQAHSEDKYLVTLTAEGGEQYEFQMLGHIFRAAQVAPEKFVTFDPVAATSVLAPRDGR